MASLLVKVGVDVTGADALGRLGDNIGSVGRKLTTSLTLPILGAGAAITKVSVDFDTALRQIVAQTDVTAGEIGGVKDSILALSSETGRVPLELAEAFKFLASEGLSTANAIAVLELSAKAAAAGFGDTQDVAQILGGIINAYGADNITAAKAADILTAAIHDGAAEASDFVSVLGPVTPIAANLGVSFDQVAAAIAGMTLANVDADTAATSLKNVLTSILKPTAEAESTLKDLGTSSAALRTELREKGLLATLRDLKARFGDNDAVIGKVFGNVRALTGVTALLGLSEEQLNNVFGDTAGALGDLEAAYKDTEGPGRELERANADIQATLIDLGDTVLPIVVDLVHGLRDGLKDLRKWWDSLDDGMKKNIVTGIGLAAVLGPVLVVIGLMASGIAAIAPVAAALVSPVAILGAGIAYIGIKTGLFAALLDSLKPLLKTASKLFGALADTVGRILSGQAGIGELGDIFGEFADNFDGAFGDIADTINEFKNNVADLVRDIVPAIARGLSDLFAWITAQAPVIARQLLKWAKAFIDWIAPMIPPVLQQLGVWVVAIANWLLTEGIPQIATALVGVADAFLDWIGPMIPKIPGALADFATGVVSWLANDALPVIVPGLAALASGLLDGIRDAIVSMFANKSPKEIADAILGLMTAIPVIAAATLAGTAVALAFVAAYSVVKTLAGAVTAAISGVILAAQVAVAATAAFAGSLIGSAIDAGIVVGIALGPVIIATALLALLALALTQVLPTVAKWFIATGGFLIGKLIEGVQASGPTFVTELLSPFRLAINGVILIINKFLRFWDSIKLTVPSVDIPGFGTVGGFTIGLPFISPIPFLDQGAFDIPQDMLALIHKGEMVVPRPFAEDMRDGRAGQQIVYNLTVQGDLRARDKEDVIETLLRMRAISMPGGALTSIIPVAGVSG